VYKYTQALGLISSEMYAVGIAGTHGKTTVTAWLGYALHYAGLHPTVFVGSAVPQFQNRNSLNGNGKLMVAETCEYRRHFLDFNPDVIAITNIEMDHPDYFEDLDDMRSAYKEYVMKLPEKGVLVHEEQVVISVHVDTKVSYGKKRGDWQLVERSIIEGKQKLSVLHASDNQSYAFTINLFGEHNALNAVLVLALGDVIRTCFPFDWDKFLSGIANFTGTKRRMEFIGTYNGCQIYDDYAHHPTELKATLSALKQMYADKKLVAIFMPHTFSRTRELFDDFAQSFVDAEQAIILPVYGSAREQDDPEMLSKQLAEAIQRNGTNTEFMQDFETVVQYLEKEVNEETVVITLGAGDNWKIARLLVQSS
jgi:UDP-N-acetylmuramate--alanine ligase